MYLPEPIVLWMESARLNALSETLAGPDDFWCGADVRQFMQGKLDKLYECKVSIEERMRVEALCREPEPNADLGVGSDWPCRNTLCRVAEGNSVHMAAIFNTYDPLDMTRIIDCYRQGGFSLLKPRCFLDLLGDFRLAAPSEFAAAIDGKSWFGNELAGIYSIDFSKALFSISSSLLEWTAYRLDDVCAAARRVCGGSTAEATDEMRTAFREALKHVEINPTTLWNLILTGGIDHVKPIHHHRPALRRP